MRDTKKGTSGVRKSFLSTRYLSDRQELHFPQLTDASPEPILITNIHGEIYYVNPAWEKFTGYSFEEIKGKNPRFLQSGKTQEKIHKKIWDSLKNGQSFSTEEIIDKKKNGEEYQVHSIFFPIRKNNENLFFVQTQHDITFRKQRDEYRNRLAFIIQSSNDAIIGMDKSGFIIEWNPAAERLFGYAATEVIGKSVNVIVPANRMKEREKIFKRLHSGENIVSFETQRIRKDGSLIDASLTVSPIKGVKGKLLGYSAIVRDITKQKENISQKDAFIGIASHELKTPITSLKTYAQILQKRLEKAPDEKNLRLIAVINEQITRLTTLINDLLNVSRLESGKLLLQRKTFSLTQLVRKVVDSIQNTTQTHTITIAGEVANPAYADEMKIEEVLINLITNAIKYSPQANKVLVNIVQANNRAVISVQDFGLGISKSEQQHLFERFYRTKNKEKNMISGFGLGLHIASEIIKKHRCKLWVESETGKGSTFSFTLPLVK